MTEKKKIIFIAGCSHAAGSEIDGTEDSLYNRQNSFPTHLSNLIGRFHVHSALVGATNATIARSVIEWFNDQYDPDNMDVFVLVCWTDASRFEAPTVKPIFYSHNNLSVDWFSRSCVDYDRITIGKKPANDHEHELYDTYQRFMVNNLNFLEIMSANYVLQIQYFLKMQNIKFMMCNSMPMFTTKVHVNFYKQFIDKSCYIDFDNNDMSFYYKYKNLGFTNELAQYDHHGAEPHKLYADYLYKFIRDRNIL